MIRKERLSTEQLWYIVVDKDRSNDKRQTERTNLSRIEEMKDRSGRRKESVKKKKREEEKEKRREEVRIQTRERERERSSGSTGRHEVQFIQETR